MLVVVDTLRRDHLASYGYARDTAPALRRLGEQGAVFDGFSVSSWTKPAVASLLTGLHPLRHGALLDDALPAAAETLAERLRARGFHTLGITSNAHITAPFGFDQGFDELVALMPDFESGAAPRPADLNRELLARLDRLTPPFFLYLHYLDPHAPYQPETAWDGGPLPAALVARGSLRGADLSQRLFRRRDPVLVRDAIDLYDGEIRGVDVQLAAALAALAARGLDAGTFTIVTADHGEEFEEHGRMGHGKTLHAESVEVPLLLHAPGAVPAGLRGGRASLLDVVPTALELLGVEPGATPLDGLSLVPQLRGEPPVEPRELLLHLDLREVGRLGQLALVSGDEKLLLSRLPYAKQVFDLAADPAERHDLGRERGETVRRLGARLAVLYRMRREPALPRARVEVDAELREALAALGYVSSGVSSGVGGGVGSGDADPGAEPLPAQLRPADPRPGGRLGWERAGPAAACVRPAEREALEQLLEGWWGPESGGRWSEPAATLALGRPGPGALTLRLVGINPTAAPLRVRLSVGDAAPVDREAAPGRFELQLEAAATGEADPLTLRIERLPPLVPGRVAAAGREGLGVFVTRVCLVARPRAGAPSAARDADTRMRSGTGEAPMRRALLGLTLGLAVPLSSASAEESGLTLRHIANEGFLLAGGGRSLLVDALFRDGLAGYAAPSAELLEWIESARPPFDVDLVLASHHHADHFDPDAVARHLRRNPKAHFVSTRQAVERLLERAPELAERADGVWPGDGGRQRLTRSGLELELLGLHHGRQRQPPVENLGFLTSLGGVSVLHVGDTMASAADLEPFALLDPGVEVALLPSWFAHAPQWSDWPTALAARRVVVMHLPSPAAPASWFGASGRRAGMLAEIRSRHPEALLMEPGDSVSLGAPGATRR